VNFAKIAKAYDIKGEVVADPNDIAPALKRAIHDPGDPRRSTLFVGRVSRASWTRREFELVSEGFDRRDENEESIEEWNTGILEWWNNGKHNARTIPLFQHSDIPIFPEDFHASCFVVGFIFSRHSHSRRRFMAAGGL
jgi:hypothetical protein